MYFCKLQLFVVSPAVRRTVCVCVQHTNAQDTQVPLSNKSPVI